MLCMHALCGCMICFTLMQVLMYGTFWVNAFVNSCYVICMKWCVKLNTWLMHVISLMGDFISKQELDFDGLSNDNWIFKWFSRREMDFEMFFQTRTVFWDDWIFSCQARFNFFGVNSNWGWASFFLYGWIFIKCQDMLSFLSFHACVIRLFNDVGFILYGCA